MPTRTERTTSERPPAGLEHKSALGAGTVQVADEAEGIVQAIVSVTGVKDRVNDVILPGAYRGRPIGVWSHDDKMWASRTEDVQELLPGDPRLPSATSDGRPWPAEAGGLWVETRYNLDTRVGKEAFSNVKFFAGQTGWSIGYRVPPGGSYMRDGTRFIKELECWEYSPVMVGAASEPMTLSVKSAAGAVDMDMRYAGATDDPAALHAAAVDDVDWDEVADADPGPDHRPPPAGGAGQGGWAAILDGASSTPPGVPDDEVPPEDLADDAEVKKAFGGKERQQAAKAGEAMPDGSYPIRNWSDLKNAISAYGRAKDKDATKRHIIKRARALKATNLLPKDWDGSTKKSLNGGGGLLDLDAVAQQADREAKAGGADRNRGGAENLRHWYVEGGGAAEIAWGTDGDFMRCVSIAGKHMTPENSRGYCNLRHQEAVGAPPGKGHKGLLDGWDPAAEVGPDAAWQPPPSTEAFDEPTEAKAFPFIDGSFEAAQALLRRAVWEQFRGELLEGDDETGEPADGAPAMAAEDGAAYKNMGMPHGGDEDEYEWDDVSIIGTWPDRVVVSRCQWQDGDLNRETFELPYTIAGDQVTLGEATQVELRVDIAPPGLPEEEEPAVGDEPAETAVEPAPAADLAAAPVAGMVDQATTGMKAMLAVTGVKAGRVLSASNAGRLRSAVERLLEVLADAGVDVEAPAPRAMPDGEMKAGTVLLDPADYTRGLRLRAGL